MWVQSITKSSLSSPTHPAGVYISQSGLKGMIFFKRPTSLRTWWASRWGAWPGFCPRMGFDKNENNTEVHVLYLLMLGLYESMQTKGSRPLTDLHLNTECFSCPRQSFGCLPLIAKLTHLARVGGQGEAAQVHQREANNKAICSSVIRGFVHWFPLNALPRSLSQQRLWTQAPHCTGVIHKQIMAADVLADWSEQKAGAAFDGVPLLNK